MTSAASNRPLLVSRITLARRLWHVGALLAILAALTAGREAAAQPAPAFVAVILDDRLVVQPGGRVRVLAMLQQLQVGRRLLLCSWQSVGCRHRLEPQGIFV